MPVINKTVCNGGCIVYHHRNLNESFDIILTRHVLQHLPNQDVLRILYNLSTSGSKYLLVTTFPEEKLNKNLDNPGDFRRLNLQIPPISLMPPLCMHKDGYLRDGGYLGLWELPLQQFEHCNGRSFECCLC